MKSVEIKSILSLRGFALTYHAKDKMAKENIMRSDIFEVLNCGLDSKIDSSIRNDKSFAWNNSAHQTLTFNDLTVVFCIGKDGVLVINSVYHGSPHDILSNVYNRTSQTTQLHNYSFGNRKVFR
jgi:hypothetical protein